MYLTCVSLSPQEEDEVPDDETINQMLAREEEEFEFYQVFVDCYFVQAFIEIKDGVWNKMLPKN